MTGIPDRDRRRRGNPVDLAASGRRGGAARTAAKIAAARWNGRLGGRPRKPKPGAS
jgi:hypothetical protein